MHLLLLNLIIDSESGALLKLDKDAIVYRVLFVLVMAHAMYVSSK